MAAALSATSSVDGPSVALLAAMWAGLALAYEGHRQGWLPAPLAVLLGLFSMNFAFTVWHEGIHLSLARNGRLNHWIGRLGAFPVLIPYSRLRVHHILHHRYTNDPERDPDHWQTRGAFFTLALRAPAGEREARRIYQREDPPAAEIRADRIQLGLSAALVLVLLLASPWSALFAIVIPRALLVYLQSLYVNYLPHAWLPADQYASSRLLRVPRPLSWLMLRHDYHALHHAYPAIPWHRYERGYDVLREDLSRRGVTTLGRGKVWGLLLGREEAPL